MHTTVDKFHQELYLKADAYVHKVYKLTKNFPSEEKFGLTSQLRRVSLSVILNYIEGYARQKYKVNRNFLEISYGSLKESQYLLKFVKAEDIISNDKFSHIFSLGDELGAMLWSTLKSIEQ